MVCCVAVQARCPSPPCRSLSRSGSSRACGVELLIDHRWLTIFVCNRTDIMIESTTHTLLDCDTAHHGYLRDSTYDSTSSRRIRLVAFATPTQIGLELRLAVG